jgi:hypothetical protein
MSQIVMEEHTMSVVLVAGTLMNSARVQTVRGLQTRSDVSVKGTVSNSLEAAHAVAAVHLVDHVPSTGLKVSLGHCTQEPALVLEYPTR